MVNPLRGFISKEGSLFKEMDVSSRGISLYNAQGINDLFSRVFDTLAGRTAHITIGGDTVTLDRRSAEAFFERNEHRFHGLVREKMTLKEKILRLLDFTQESKTKHLPGLPMGLFEENAFGGKEGRLHIVGMLHQFESVLDVLENNNFDVSLMRKELQGISSKFVQIERDLFLERLVDPNLKRIHQLTSSLGRPELQDFARFLIERIQKRRLDSK
jgi:hypothetical protein